MIAASLPSHGSDVYGMHPFLPILDSAMRTRDIPYIKGYNTKVLALADDRIIL